ncbi:MAG: hypothetical protein ABJG47_08935 [Ekhidna sp.]
MKKRSIVLLAVLAVLLNSCVYSLFPIYTEDTLVFKEELLGMWDLGDNSYMIFQRGTDEDDQEEEKGEDAYKYSIKIKEGFTMSSNDPISMVIKGDTVYDEDLIREEMLRRMAKNEGKNTPESKGASKLIDRGSSVAKRKKLEYEGSITVFEEKSYQLTVVDEEKGSETAYTAHLADIGGDLFLDLYPITNYSSKDFSDNYFPVHTFYKVEITEDTFTMIHFDLDKLNDLFESNLIRLRHENVQGTILITAQPKELQKFFDKYADDESVFDNTETYKRASL